MVCPDLHPLHSNIATPVSGAQYETTQDVQCNHGYFKTYGVTSYTTRCAEMGVWNDTTDCQSKEKLFDFNEILHIINVAIYYRSF